MMSRELLASVALFACLTACAAPNPTTPEPTADAELRVSNATLHERLADRALARGDLESARDSSRESLRLDPSRAAAARVLARAEYLSGRPDQALFAALRAARLTESDPTAWMLVFDCADAAGDDTTAERALDRAVELGSHEAILTRAGLALETGDTEPIRGLLEAHPGDAVAASLYGEYLARTGRETEAVSIVDRAILESKDPRLETVRSRLLGAITTPPAESSREHVESGLLAASHALRGGNAQDALERFRDAAKSEPNAPGPRIGIGEALFALGDVLGAQAAFEAALDLAPRDVDALLGLARVHLRTRSFADAVVPLERALSIQRDLAPARGLLVAAAIGLGDLDRARSEAAHLRRLDPGGALDLKCRDLLMAAEGVVR